MPRRILEAASWLLVAAVAAAGIAAAPLLRDLLFELVP